MSVYSEYLGQPITAGDSDGDRTLLDGTTFCISGANGDIERGRVQGLFVRDTRFCSRFAIRIDGSPTQPVSTISREPFARTFVSRARPTLLRPETMIVLCRHRTIGDGMEEVIEIKNLGDLDATVEVTVELDADFAHLFDVKDDHVRPRGFHSVEATTTAIVYEFREHGRSRRLSVMLPTDAEAAPGVITFTPMVAGRSAWSRSLRFEVELDGRAVSSRASGGRHLTVSDPASPTAPRRRDMPSVQLSNEILSAGVRRSEADLGALRIFDPDHPDEPIIAAGAPWYMALFGRDSLIASWMTLLVDPQIASGTLRALARRQGTAVVPATDEEPGKILHELRFRLEGPGDGSEASAYFGSIDATPLFVMLLGEARRWGLPLHTVEKLLPHADRAITWMETYGDRDGDGFIEYSRLAETGFINQGWKDSVDGVNFADGSLPELPVALCEVQGYAYNAAYAARYEIARELGDHETAEHCAERAARLRRSFNEAFWIADRGYFAIGLDGNKRQIDALTSNIGHLLWTGIVDEDKAPEIGRHLAGADLFAGFGIRTLGASMGAYNPMSYHNGSVWPHDNALAIAGLMRYGLVAEAHTVLSGLLDALDSFHGRLPELFSGFSRGEFDEPVAYPTACAPQAWASAALFSVLRSLLRLDPSVGHGIVHIAPAMAPLIERVRIEDVPIGSDRVTIVVDGDKVAVEGLGPELSVRRDPAPVHWSFSG